MRKLLIRPCGAREHRGRQRAVVPRVARQHVVCAVKAGVPGHYVWGRTAAAGLCKIPDLAGIPISTRREIASVERVQFPLVMAELCM